MKMLIGCPGVYSGGHLEECSGGCLRDAQGGI